MASHASAGPDPADPSCSSHSLDELIEHVAEWLPAQGPITAFVHHNPLHHLETRSFWDATRQSEQVLGNYGLLPEARYRRAQSEGRFDEQDLEAALLRALGESAQARLPFGITKQQLLWVLLTRIRRAKSAAELQWFLEENEALLRFDAGLPEETLRGLREASAAECAADATTYVERARSLGATPQELAALAALIAGGSSAAVSLHMTWFLLRHVLRQSGHTWSSSDPQGEAAFRGPNDRIVNAIVMPFLAAIIDQGMAAVSMPGRDEGILRAFIQTHAEIAGPLGLDTLRLRALIRELEGQSADTWIERNLSALRISSTERAAYLRRTALALRGFAGMLWQLENRPDRAARGLPKGSFKEYLAMRLLLERVAEEQRLAPRFHQDEVAWDLERPEAANVGLSIAFEWFQVAQHLGWSYSRLAQLHSTDWAELHRLRESFGSWERRAIYHAALERHHFEASVHALWARYQLAPARPDAPCFQLICCIDEREESFRRHVEEVEARVETFGTAGFFGVAMNYQGMADAHPTPLCPVVVRAEHDVCEVPSPAAELEHEQWIERRRWRGFLTQYTDTHHRRLVGGAIASILGAFSSIPLVAQVLMPRRSRRVASKLSALTAPPPRTRVLYEQFDSNAGADARGAARRYQVTQMAQIVEGQLRAIGIGNRFAPLIVLLGHGSSSLNNPHKAAYDCGACGGGHGGPNARVFAAMANDPRVRALLSERGIHIPTATWFVGAYHNTCADTITYFDLDALPEALRTRFRETRHTLESALIRNAHERCRRFMSAALTLTPAQARDHVEARANDLGQARPECGHATNALLIVGRRARTRGLYLDRRAFLVSYDPLSDDEEGSILGRILGAVFPVCAGINLEYFYSVIDSAGWGCGTKLPHNITSLIGVMDGAASDLRTGLPWQMVEIHEPLRLLCFVETTVATMERILARDGGNRNLIHNEWLRLVLIDPSDGRFYEFHAGGFVLLNPACASKLTRVRDSLSHYRGQREHLDCALIEDALLDHELEAVQIHA